MEYGKGKGGTPFVLSQRDSTSPFVPESAAAMAAQLLIIISKPPEMTGRKAMGAKVLDPPGKPRGGFLGRCGAKEAKPASLAATTLCQPGRRILCIRINAEKGRYS